ncbi:MAG: CocE/NonD family hydrolase [Hyphomicrobiales bacterium]|nr:CocE/NonD family hydrolase [Hyphomicrobiales bacterium]
MLGTATADAALEKGKCTVRKEADVPARMRDGTILMADVYRPEEPGTYPVILQRLPYNKTAAQTYVYGKPEDYASHCYVVVIQDVRGQYKSEGEFYPFRHEGEDGYDTVEWAAKLPGSTGKVGMYGFSYVGATQWLAAAEAPPSLVAIAPAQTSSDYYDGWSYQGGEFHQAFEQSWPLTSIAVSGSRRLGEQSNLDAIAKAVTDLPALYRHLPLIDYLPRPSGGRQFAPYYFDWVDHDTWDDYWKKWSIRTRYDKIKVPALNFGGWYDIFLAGGVENFTGMKQSGGSPEARQGQHLVVGPYIHLPWQPKVGELDFGPEAANPIDQLQLRWFDHWLKGEQNGVETEKPVHLFVMGANRWRDADSWPVEGAAFRSYYLHSLGAANSRYGNGSLSTDAPKDNEPVDRFAYDPADPVPSLGGHSCCTPDVAPVGPYDQAKVEDRADVLVYATPLLDGDVEVTGPVKVSLFASSTAPDTDFTAKLVDMYPDGKAYNISNGIIRASSREGLDKRVPIEPGQVYKYDFALQPTANLFKAGHRIGVEISSSNFPHYARNLNTGAKLGYGAEPTIAHQTILHDVEHPSQIVLPIVSPALSETAKAR